MKDAESLLAKIQQRRCEVNRANNRGRAFGPQLDSISRQGSKTGKPAKYPDMDGRPTDTSDTFSNTRCKSPVLSTLTQSHNLLQLKEMSASKSSWLRPITVTILVLLGVVIITLLLREEIYDKELSPSPAETCPSKNNQSYRNTNLDIGLWGHIPSGHQFATSLMQLLSNSTLQPGGDMVYHRYGRSSTHCQHCGSRRSLHSKKGEPWNRNNFHQRNVPPSHHIYRSFES